MFLISSKFLSNCTTLPSAQNHCCFDFWRNYFLFSLYVNTNASLTWWLSFPCPWTFFSHGPDWEKCVLYTLGSCIIEINDPFVLGSRYSYYAWEIHEVFVGGCNPWILLHIPLLYAHKLCARSIIDGYLGYFCFGLLNTMCMSFPVSVSWCIFDCTYLQC